MIGVERPEGVERAYLRWFRGALAPASQRFVDGVTGSGATVPLGLCVEDRCGRPAGRVGIGEAPMPRVPADSVIMAIIDDGIAFAHERFRFGSRQSRVASFWLQDGTRPPGTDHRVPFGREIGRGEIDQLLADHAEAGIVDETGLYRDPRVGLADALLPRGTNLDHAEAHGTMVLDLLAGFPSGEGGNRPILAVQLPQAVTRESSGIWLPGHALLAVEWILKRADALAAASGVASLPIVLNFSYGIYAGPHDGQSALERHLDALIEARRQARKAPLHLVMPAGNSYLTRTHARVSLAPATEATVPLRVQPEDQSPSFVEIWGPPLDAQSAVFELEVTAPDGAAMTVSQDRSGATLTRHGAPIAQATLQVINGPMGRRTRGFLALAPTAGDNPTRARAPAGLWTITLRGRGAGTVEPVHLWVQRDDTIAGSLTGARQAYFPEQDHGHHLDGNGREAGDGDGIVFRSDTLNALATGANTVIAAACRGSDLTPARYSSGGRVGSGRDPDVAVICEDGVAHPGLLAAGSRSGAAVVMRGTSFAAPRIGRWIADHAALVPDARALVRAAAVPDAADVGGARKGAGVVLDLHPVETGRRRGPRRAPDIGAADGL